MTATRHQTRAQLLAIPFSIAWSSTYALIAGVSIVTWVHLNVAYFNRLPNVELMKMAAYLGTAVIGGYSYFVGIPWAERQIEARRLTWLGWNDGL